MTPLNYSQLQSLHEKYSTAGLSILAFPSDTFNQEKGSNAEIEKQICVRHKFDMFAKIKVNGKHADPLFKYLQNHSNTTGFMTNTIKWNFTKFLVDKQGVPWKRYSPKEEPLSFENDIKSKL